ncbi:gephyrin-like molybdotransferase Glp [Methanosarcina sp.]|uniref:molybdopterin molybdotransferase MoeA n=1 Tax=Methanosarcina sp. TaxID=2213 RepID=UPI002988B343|nr:gephyrin-like molybdotransferase Glp [Methanosarcina sp.]MDW5549378.1 molybdopterin molybdotransferase MoeA [Methanosarcina sp.]MDW5553431.1 molybdopterin molybdotransferase MoeA [Methanosarcina sp.]MDW5559755.1 molybdopterin molybdotransferase MoeA [Methanosarcina sp.]
MGRIFKKRTSVDEALNLFLERISTIKKTEEISLETCTDRVLAEAVISERNVPHYRRAAMDGYAVRASDTMGTSPSNPVMLQLSDRVKEGTSTWVHTGALVPEGANAVVMVEDTITAGNLVEIRAQVYPGKNVGNIGEDIKRGEVVFEEGHLLRPCDIAVLASLGFGRVKVFKKPVVAVIPTGDELVSRQEERDVPPPGMVLETNGLMSSLYVKKWGGIPRYLDIVPDNPDNIKRAIEANLDTDMILLSGGTSVGKRDHASEVVAALGELLVHGIGVSPGKPSALGIISNTPVVCLPGYPVAGLVSLYFFVRPGIRKLATIPEIPEPILKKRLAAKISSKIGYVNFVRVVFEGDKVRPLTGNGDRVLTSVAKADGYVLVPENVEGYEEGEEVDVFLIE